jgi:hypothetical protein
MESFGQFLFLFFFKKNNNGENTVMREIRIDTKMGRPLSRVKTHMLLEGFGKRGVGI